jgi:hypothetical protein
VLGDFKRNSWAIMDDVWVKDRIEDKGKMGFGRVGGVINTRRVDIAVGGGLQRLLRTRVRGRDNMK